MNKLKRILRWSFATLPRRIISSLLIVLFIIAPLSFYFWNKSAEATWWNDDWFYRKSIIVTNNTTAENNVYITLTLDTSDTTKFQSDCGDIRFIKNGGENLPYYIVSGCGTTSTIIHTNFDVFDAGTQSIDFYYGNPMADNGFSTTDFATQASNYTIGTIGQEQKGPSPVLYLPLDEGFGATAHDETSFRNDGTIVGATWKEESDCVSGKCLGFDGADDVVTITQNSAINLTGKTGYSVSTWIKANSDGELVGEIIDKGINTYLRVDNETGNNLDIEGQIDLETTSANLNISAGITKNSWNHIEMVYADDGDDEISIYINGYLKGTSSGGDGSLKTESNNLLIGGDISNNFQGFIDEPKIYPYARTADQIKQDYNAGLSGVKASAGTSVSMGGKSSKWMSDGLVGYWKMDEASWNGTAGEVKDASGNENHGVASGGASTTGGKFGNGGSFDGDGDSVTLGEPNVNIGTDGDEEYSFCSWFNTTQSDAYDVVLNYKRQAGRHSIRTNRTTWENTFQVLQTINYSDVSLTSTSIINDGNWHHWCFVQESYNSRQLFIDGGLEDSDTTLLVPSGSNTFNDFNISSPNIYSWQGKIDETRIYNRALSLDEVQQLYKYAPGPVMHLKMDEKTGTTAFDSSGNNNNGTLTNGPVWENGKINGGIRFDGVDDYVLSQNSYSATANQELTITAWIYPRDLTALATHYIAGIGKVGTCYGGYLYTYGSALYFNNGTGGGDLQIGTGLMLNDWNHVVVVANASGSYGYINGVYKESGEKKILTCSQKTAIGLIGEGGITYFKGLIDDVKIYNYARTQEQILEDMSAQGGSALGGGGTALKQPILDMSFDEGVGETAYDANDNGKNGTLVPGGAGGNTTATMMWDKGGEFGGSVEFDGDDYISVPDFSY